MVGSYGVWFDARRRQQLFLALASGLRTASYYDGGNVVMRQACDVLYSLISDSGDEEGPVSVGVRSHCGFVNQGRVPASASTYGRMDFVFGLFEEWGINTLTFYPGLTADELTQALTLLARHRPSDTADLADLLSSQGIETVKAEMFSSGKGRQFQAFSPIVAYSTAMQMGVELGASTGPIEAGTVRRVRHVTQAIVDELLRDAPFLLTLATIKDFDNYLVLHSVNVAVLSTVLGQRLGLDKATLGELCLSAFLHDAGKLGVDPDVLNKPGSLDAEEWQQMQRHPVLAAQALLNSRHLTASNMRSMVVAFEHHLNYDLSGYPRTEIKKSVSLFGGIVSIADRFDALTTARVYRKVNLTPPEALLYVVENSGKHFDRVLVKLFVEVMGIYPPGTVVVLSQGEAGVVCRPPALGSSLDRPQVRVIVGGEPGSVIDLEKKENGGYARSIIGVLNPSNKGQIPAVDPAIFTSI